MKILCRVTDFGLQPLYDTDHEQKQRLKKGKIIVADIKIPRNYKFHKKFFALLTLTLDNLPEYIQQTKHIHTIDNLLDAVKIDLGHYDIIHINHQPTIKLHSISFAKMDNSQFEQFYHRTLQLILTKYLIGTSQNDLQQEVQNMISRF